LCKKQQPSNKSKSFIISGQWAGAFQRMLIFHQAESIQEFGVSKIPFEISRYFFFRLGMKIELIRKISRS
jgi:hypothetical protein